MVVIVTQTCNLARGGWKQNHKIKVIFVYMVRGQSGTQEIFVLHTHKENITGIREMVQLVKCLPCKHEDLSSVPRTHILKKCRACSLREAEIGGSWG